MEKKCPPLIEILAEIPDFRKAKGKRHPLPAILALACVAVMCGCRGYRAIAEWGRNHDRRFAEALGFTHKKTPCASTLGTIFGNISVDRTTKEVNRALKAVLGNDKYTIKTITPDNGTEFHQFRRIEKDTGVEFYFPPPYQSWARGTNENTNGLIRQYLPKGTSMTKLTQVECNRIARDLNRRPRRRYGFRTPEELYV